MDAVNAQSRWDEATERVMAYYAALGLGGVEARTRETLRVIEAARSRCASDSTLFPVETAMEGAFDSLARWFAQLAPCLSVERGLAALQASGDLARWPDVDETLRARLAKIPLIAAPEIDFSNMAARDMNFGALETIAHETWQKFDWGPVLRAAALWTAIFFLSLYAYDRFFAP
jgi:hypothetical protein